MNTVGQIFKDERLKKGFSLEQVEKATKIRRKFLQAIETDAYQQMPASPYIQGFIKNYSDFLGLRSTTMHALFRRQFLEREKGKKMLIEEPLTPVRQITPNKVIFAGVVLLIFLLFGYFYTQYRVLHTPPPLSLENPKEELVTKEETVSVFGNTDSDATVTINSEPILVKEDGKFFKDMSLTIGENIFVIEATNRSGEKTTLTRHVTRLAAVESSP